MQDPATPNEPDAASRQEQVAPEHEGRRPRPEAAAATPEGLLADEPSPQVEPIYLRKGRHPRPRRERSVLHPPGWDEAASETLVNAITRRVLEGLAASLLESVHAAVLALAPRMVISLAEDEDSPAGARAHGDEASPSAPPVAEQQ